MLGDDEKGVRHYQFLVYVSETIEEAEESFCRGARLFFNEGMRVEQVRMGYEHNQSYLKLSGQTGDVASMDAFFELQTILRPQEGKVGKVLDRLQKEYLKAEATIEAETQAAEATNEAETQVESDWTEPVGQGIDR